MTIDQERRIEEALIFSGFEVEPAECDICEDGSVWYGLTEIMPKGSISTIWEDDYDYDA